MSDEICRSKTLTNLWVTHGMLCVNCVLISLAWFNRKPTKEPNYFTPILQVNVNVQPLTMNVCVGSSRLTPLLSVCVVCCSSDREDEASEA